MSLRILNQPKGTPPSQAAPQQGPPQGPGGGGGLPPEMMQALLGGGAPDGATDPATSGGGGSRMDSEKVGQDTSGYLGPEAGPFACGNCFHFDGKGSCAIVQGNIDPAGCCNLFESASSQDPDQDGDQDSPTGPDVDGPPQTPQPTR